MAERDPYLTVANLEDRLGQVAVKRLLANGSGASADESALARVIKDASSKVRGVLGPGLDLTTVDKETAEEVTRIALDVAHAYLAIRRPEVLRVDGFKMMKLAESELMAIRNGKTDLGTEQAPDVTPYATVYSTTPRGW